MAISRSLVKTNTTDSMRMVLEATNDWSLIWSTPHTDQKNTPLSSPPPISHNPPAILMTVPGAIGALFSVLDSRPSGPIRTEDEDHMQGHGHFAILGEDEYYRLDEDGLGSNQ